MTSSFPEEQYRPQALSGSFNPIEQVDIAPAIRAEQERQMAPERARLQEIADNDKMRIQDAGQYGKDLETLGQFSETLATQLIEYQEKENEKAMQRGIMQAFTDGVSLEQKVSFDKSESALETADIAVKKDAADAEANGASVFTGEKIRSFSGWERYGYYKGKMQIAAQGFPLFIQQNADGGEGSNYAVNIDGRAVTLNNARTPEEASAVLSKMVSGYLAPFAGLNSAMADKYLLTPMRASMQQQMVLFAQKRGAEITKERIAERKNNFFQNLRQAEQIDAQPALDGSERIPLNLGEFGSSFIQNHENGPAAGKAELAELIKNGLKNGELSPEQAERIVTDLFKWNDGSLTSLLKKDPGVFGFVPQLIEDTRLSNIRRDNQLEAAEQQEFISGLIQIATSDDGKIDLEERSAALKAWRDSPYGYRPVPEELSGLYTTDDATKDEQRSYLEAIAEANGGVIAPQYTIGLDAEVLKEFEDQIGAGAAVENSLKDFKEPRKEFLTGLLNEKQLLDTGGNYKDTQASIIAYNLSKEFDKQFAIYSKNYTPEEAFNKTRELIQNSVAFNYNRYKKITSADELARDNRQQAVAALQNGFDISNGLLPGLQQTDLESAYTYLTTGRGSIPYVFKYLAARDPKLSALELAGKQLEASGYKDFEIPQIELDVSASENPQIRRMLRYKNTPSRTLRASIEDPELVNVLDRIAGVESGSDGEYDAYNLGGYSANEPIGSGNSAEDLRFGKPISQLTIGEIMSLHRQGKVHAVGRYQFTPVPFREVVQGLGLPKNTVFDNRIQDIIALYRLRWRINRNNSTTGLINEWAGLSKLRRSELQDILEDAQDILDPYNAPELLLKGL